MANKIGDWLTVTVTTLKDLLRGLVDILLPAVGVLVLSDVLLGTKSGVLERALQSVSSIGLNGNALVIVVVVLVFGFVANRKA